MPRVWKRRAYGRGRSTPPQKRRVFSESPDGCIKITIGRSRIVVWNNCGRDITIPAGKALKAAVTSRVKYELDYGSATAIFAEPVRDAEEDSANTEPDIKDYDWV